MHSLPISRRQPGNDWLLFLREGSGQTGPSKVRAPSKYGWCGIFLVRNLVKEFFRSSRPAEVRVSRNEPLVLIKLILTVYRFFQMGLR